MMKVNMIRKTSPMRKEKRGPDSGSLLFFELLADLKRLIECLNQLPGKNTILTPTDFVSGL